jgi:hypothetical protein
MKLLVGAVLALAVGLGMSAPASADPCISGPCTYTTATAYYPTTGSATTDWYTGTQTISLPQFDASLGTLESVTVYFGATVNSSGWITTNSSSSATVNSDSFINLKVDILQPTFSGPIGVNDPNNYAANNLLLQVQPALLAMGDTTVPLTGNVGGGVNSCSSYSGTGLGAGSTTDTACFNIQNSSASGNKTVSVVPANYATYVGSGDVTFELFTQVRTQTDISGGNVASGETTTASANAYAVYTYTPAPEPATMALLATGLIGLAAVRRRKRG